MKKKYRYIADYEISNATAGKSLVYLGQYFRVEMDSAIYKRAKTRMLIIALIQPVLFVLMGIVGNLTTRTVYAGLPYAFLIIPTLYLLYGSVRFYKYDTALERRQYERDFMNMAGFAIIAILLSGACAIGGAIWLIQTSHPVGIEYLFMPLSVIYLLAVYRLLANWREIERHIKAPEP